MPTPMTMFYAYPARPPDLTETLEAAVQEINKGDLLRIDTWKIPPTTGKVIIDTITQNIDLKPIFGCDLTYLNMNVLFELGFAIGRAKRLWVSLNETVEEATKNYRRLETLLPVGYAPYSNRFVLVNKLYEEKPWADVGTPSVSLNFGGMVGRRRRVLLFYLKSSLPTDASIVLSQQLSASRIFSDVVIDDPAEVAWQTLEWYVHNIQRTTAVVVHLLGDNQSGTVWHNIKCSFVAGLAHGLSKPLLMLAHAPFDCPIDYRTLLKTHANAAECRRDAQNWLDATRDEIVAQTERVTDYQRIRQSATDLQRLSVGEMVAENEDKDIDAYFVETSAYLQALSGHQTIFVGRKGTGKTANLYAVSSELQRSPANLVCIIKPVAYEVEGVLRMLRQSIERSERGYLVESMWKFLIYTQIANCVVSELRERPLYQVPTELEIALLDFVSQNSEIIEPSFSVRLQNAVVSLVGIDAFRSGSEQRAKVSELLHERLIARLRQLLGDVLGDRNRVAVLVDNLDKAWERGRDFEYLAELLFGLLGVVGRIRDEFQTDAPRRRWVNLTLAVFLRSDIFTYILDVARERDKLTFERLTWNDRQLLLRVLEERLSYSLDEGLTADQIWERFFVPTVSGSPTKEFLVRSVIPRPRDIIFLVKAAIGDAVNRGHVRVEEEDVKSALRSYSQYLLDSLIVEDDPRLGMLEAVLYEFAGSPPELSRPDVENHLRRAGVSDQHTGRYLDMLLDLNFLGIKMPNGDFAFPIDEGDRRVSQKVAGRIAENHGHPETFLINSPFRPVLQIV